MWECNIYTTDINVTKISAKINSVQNIIILLFVDSLFLTSLTFEVKQGRPTDHQASTQLNSDIMDRAT